MKTLQQSIKIPFIYLDRLLNSLTPFQYKVLMCIVKNYYGFSKKVTLLQIYNETRVPQNTARVALELLEDEGLIKKTLSLDHNVKPIDRNLYSIVELP